MKNCMLILLLLSGLALRAQSDVCPCCTESYRHFDFWLGSWDVYSNGNIAGTNSITLSQDSCLIVENWIGARGVTGTSMNYYDRSEKIWNQLWIDSRGSTLKLKGNYNGSSMIMLSDPVTDQEGRVILQRITWSPLNNNKVQQLWENSTDGGNSWNTVFDGLYQRKKIKH